MTKRTLVQILLPKVDGRGVPVPASKLQCLAQELAELFGGVTSYLRAPAEGLWQPQDDAPSERDDIVVLEVMVEHLEPDFWRPLKARLEADLAQSEIVIRAQAVDLL